MRFILPVLVTVVFLSSCTSKEEESATPTSPLVGVLLKITRPPVISQFEFIQTAPDCLLKK
jgi:hypothetical protein